MPGPRRAWHYAALASVGGLVFTLSSIFGGGVNDSFLGPVAVASRAFGPFQPSLPSMTLAAGFWVLLLPLAVWAVAATLLKATGYDAWLFLALLLSGAALWLPFESDAHGMSPGWQKMLGGWLFVLTGQSLVWLSGPLVVAAWALIGAGSSRVATYLALGALLVTLPSLAGSTLRYGWGESIIDLRPQPEFGYYVWLCAIGATVLSAVALGRMNTAAAAMQLRRAE